MKNELTQCLNFKVLMTVCLPFSSLDSSRVDVDLLEHREPQLARSYVVAVGSSDDYRHLELLYQFKCSIRLMIGSSIPVDHSVFAPVPLLLVEVLIELS